MSKINFADLAERKTIDLLKRYSCQSIEELEQIASREYATNHFDITTIKLIVEALLQEASEAGLTNDKVAQLGSTAINHYPHQDSLSCKQRELKHWQDNRHRHGTPTPAWIAAKQNR